MKHRGLFAVVIMLAISTSTHAQNKNVYQTTKLLELIGSTEEFCFVVQINDLAYGGC